jgi:hypothetical protein
MRHLYLFIVFSFSISYLAAQMPQPLQGYIVTKNNYQLTGSIGTIDHSSYGTMVEYINDFGTPYFLHPALIKGFVFYEGPAIRAYESKRWQDSWYFLKVQYGGDNISLLQTPELQTSYNFRNGQLYTRTRKSVQYWISMSDGFIQPLKRLGFRSQMKRLIRDVSPQLARKIGSKGYRFQNLYTILEEYDRELAKGKVNL